MYKNNDLIYDATERLATSTGADIDVYSHRKEYDAVITINGIQFIVLAKAEVKASNKGIILSGIKAVKTNKPVIIIAKYIAKEVALELKERGVNYLDIAGNSYIKHKGVFIYVNGQKVERVSKTNQSRAFQEAGIKLIFSLLADKQALQYSYRKLAEKTGVSIGSVSNVMNELEELNYILKTSEKRVLKNTRDLLQRWIVAFHDVLKPRLLKKKMRFSNADDYTNWRQLSLETTEEINLWGGEPACAILTKQLSPLDFTIYTSGGWQIIAKKLKLIPDENGNVEIYSMFWKHDAINEGLYSHLIAPALIVYADLVASGSDRNLEIAEKILENELRHIK